MLPTFEAVFIHNSNWGFLKKGGRYSLAPVFDNGSCLPPPHPPDDEAVLEMLNSHEAMPERIYGFPNSQIRLDGKKSSYHEVITSCRFPECNAAAWPFAMRPSRFAPSSSTALISSISPPYT